jgi:hypothetical protein
MLTPEERRQRILANTEARLAKLRLINQTENCQDLPPMAPVSVLAPEELLIKPNSSVDSSSMNSSIIHRTEHETEAVPSSSLFATISSATNVINSLSSLSPKTKPSVENTDETRIVDLQHIFVFVLGLIMAIAYSFYVSPQSNLFFHVYFTCCLCLLTSRYFFKQMKHRTNILISTLMLSGFRPAFVKKGVLIYTLIADAWIIFAFYFVSFCFTCALCSLFS